MYLDNISIYTKNLIQVKVNTIWWALHTLLKEKLFANLENYYLHKNYIHFFKYIVLYSNMKIKDKKIKKMKNWPESKLL